MPQVKPKLDIETELYTCKEGGPHRWIYRGKESQEYFCEKCGKYLDKATLKKETD